MSTPVQNEIIKTKEESQVRRAVNKIFPVANVMDTLSSTSKLKTEKD